MDQVVLTPYESLSEFGDFAAVFDALDKTIQPTAFVVVNNSEKAIVGIALVWTSTAKQSNKHTMTSLTHSYLSARGAPLVIAHGRVFVAPDVFVPDAVMKGGGGLIGMLPTQQTLERFGSSSVISVEVDSIVFADGEVVGPNQLGLTTSIIVRSKAAELVVGSLRSAQRRGEDTAPVLDRLSRPLPGVDDSVSRQAVRLAIQLQNSRHFVAELRYLEETPTPPKFYRTDGSQP